ncbi:restriction endonuclease subunit S [Agrobacterium vitis]
MSTAVSSGRDSSTGDQMWFGRIPNDWKVKRARRLFQERIDPSSAGTEELLSVSHISGVSARSEKNVSMFLAESLEGYKLVNPGDLVVNTMWAWMGAMGTSPLSGCVSPSYAVYRNRDTSLSPSFVDFLVRSAPFIAEVNRRSKGVWASRLRLYPDAFLDIPLPVPPLSTQHAITEFVSRQTSQIDQLIAKKERIADLICAKWEALIDDARNERGAKWVRFNTATRRMQRAIGNTEDTSFIPLGLYNRGRGFFRKLETDEEELGDSSFFWVRKGDIVFSGQFAWEGAVGFVAEEENGCVVSHRYPVYRAVDGIESAYLYAFFRTAHGAFIMDNCSRGAAGRNKPLNTWTIEREQVLIPSEKTQKAIAQLVTLEARARKLIREYVSKALELRSALVSAAVTGQIDIRDRLPTVTVKPDRVAFRLIVGAEIIHRHQGNPKFGRVKLQKELYLAEAHIGISELQGNYLREAAGPFDRALIDETEKALETQGFYRARQPDGIGGAVTYTPLLRAGQHVVELTALLGPRTEALRNLIKLLSDLDRRQVEAVATLYAVWNDTLMDGKKPDDAAIISSVLTEWHAEKGEKFNEGDLCLWLAWMKRQSLVPRGEGPRTAHTMTRDMFS